MSGFSCSATLDMIAGMFVAIFEGELGDAGLVEFAQSFSYHAVVLFFRGAGEWQIEPEFARQIQGNAAVFCGVRGREEATVLTILHVFAISLKHPRRRAGLREHFA